MAHRHSQQCGEDQVGRRPGWAEGGKGREMGDIWNSVNSKKERMKKKLKEGKDKERQTKGD